MHWKQIYALRVYIWMGRFLHVLIVKVVKKGCFKEYCVALMLRSRPSTILVCSFLWNVPLLFQIYMWSQRIRSALIYHHGCSSFIRIFLFSTDYVTAALIRIRISSNMITIFYGSRELDDCLKCPIYNELPHHFSTLFHASIQFVYASSDVFTFMCLKSM